MKVSIRMKIFLPVVFISILFPLAFWLVFSQTLSAHMTFNARRELERLIRQAERITKEEREDLKRAPENPENALYGMLMRKEPGGSGLLAVNQEQELLFPKNPDRETDAGQIYELFISEAGTWEEREIFRKTAGDSAYLLYYVPFEEANSLVFYSRIHEAESLLSQVSRLMLLIMLAMTAIEILLFWFVAGSISGPVRRLCEAARGIGDKKFRRVESHATVRELCELEDEINRMQEKLSRADEAERTFFQNASHELRTPLMSISGYAQGIQCGVLEDAAQAAGVILEESSRLTEVVDGILSLTRMDQLRYETVPEKVFLGEFLSGLVPKFAGMTLSGRIRLELGDKEACTALADRTLLEKAVVNVVSNCICYASSAVRISYGTRDGKAWLSVWDDGPEIAAEDMERIFDRFYKGQGGNHGLGLSIAKTSLEYMGGRISAKNTGNGPMFDIYLPTDREDGKTA